MFAIVIAIVRRPAPDSSLFPTQGPACTKAIISDAKASRWLSGSCRVVLWSFADGNTILHVGEATFFFFAEDKVNEYKCQFVKGAF